MPRVTTGTLALTCMGISAGVAVLLGPAVSAGSANPEPSRSAVTAAYDASPRTVESTERKTPAVRYSRKAHRETNARRGEHGLKALRRTACVQRFAVKQAQAMADRRSMYHQELGPILNQCGLNLVGENVAYGYPNGRAVVEAWMNSEGHRANILKPEYRLMGIGARQGSDGVWYVSQVFGRKA